jgi:hypothetical protein
MIQHKRLDLKATGDAGEVVADIATLNVKDKMGDVTLPGYFGKQPASIVLAHEWGPVMLGKGTITEVEDKARFTGSFNMSKDDPEARAVFSRLKFDQDPAFGEPRIEWSYGYNTLPGGSEPFTDHEEFGSGTFLRPLKDGSPGVEVAEVSPVMIGAGEGTGTVAVKGMSFTSMMETTGAPWAMTNGPATLTDKIKTSLAQLEDVTAAVSALHAHLLDGAHTLTDEKAAVLAELVEGLAKAQATVSPVLLTETTDSDIMAELLKFERLTAEIREMDHTL